MSWISLREDRKEMAALVFDGRCTLEWEGQARDVDRPNPLDYNPSCLHVCKGVEVRITAHGACHIYIQKTENDTVFPCRMYGPEDTDTWPRGDQGELMGCTKRDVRTCFDLDNAPYSNMVLGEVVNLPGKWSSRRIITPSPRYIFTVSITPAALARAGATGSYMRPTTTA